jgi:serine/threonine-protein kinase
MALDSGSRLAQYEIGGLLGAGGMGEVYAAHDTRLRREVAIKVLRGAVGDEESRLKNDLHGSSPLRSAFPRARAAGRTAGLIPDVYLRRTRGCHDSSGSPPASPPPATSRS